MDTGLSDPEATRALMKRALAVADWNQPDSTPPTLLEIDGALADIAAQVALKHSEPGLDGQVSRLIEDTLRPIGAAIDPRFAPEVAKVWRKALLLKLSNLPGPIVLLATRKAVHESFTFFGDVEPAIRKLAVDLLDRQRIATMRLERWRREIEQAANAPPRLEHDPGPPSEQDIESSNLAMRMIGSRIRWRLEGGEAVMFHLEEPEPRENAEEGKAENGPF